MGRTLYEKVYDAHVVNELSGELPLLTSTAICSMRSPLRRPSRA